MTRRGFAVRISDDTMLTPNEAAIGEEVGEDFLFQLVMGDKEDAKAYYFDRRGLDKLFRTFRRVEHWIKEEIDGRPSPTDRIIKLLKEKKARMVTNLMTDTAALGKITIEIRKLEAKDDVRND